MFMQTRVVAVAMGAARQGVMPKAARGLAARGLAARGLGTAVVPKFNKTQFREPVAGKPRLVLAYSGGLDTSTQLAYLTNELGFEVCAYIADLGQDELASDAEKEAVKEKARASGAYSFYCEDLRTEFVEDYVFPMLASNALYEGRYLLGTSIARPAIGVRQVEICAEEGATHISHGSTGKGNDQIRFELCYLAMNPNLECVTLWRDPAYVAQFVGREDLIDYATKHGISVSQSKAHSYSEDENMLHISYESGALEDPAFPGLITAEDGQSEEYPGMVLQKKSKDIMDTPDAPKDLVISYKSGIPVKVTDRAAGVEVTDSFGILSYLNTVGGEHGVGRIDIVENRFVGMKSRGCYETPGGSILHAAHHDLELLCIDREVMRIRDQLALKYGELVYNGYWHSPEMAFLKNSMEYVQRPVTGDVAVRLHKANIMLRGRSSPNTLYDEGIVSMESLDGYDPSQATGFIKTLSTRLKAVKVRDSKLGVPW